jgi:hypothetical protein
MQLTSELLEKAVKSGLAVLGPESEISIPAKHNEGIFYLRAILTSLAKGEASVTPAQPKAPPAPEGTPPKKPVAEAVGQVVREGQVVDGEAEEVSSSDE